MAEEMKRLWEDFRSGKISRREFMRQAVMITGSLATASGIIGALGLAEATALRSLTMTPRFSLTMLVTVVKPDRSRVISLVRLSRENTRASS